jgi:hypothetical protein
MQPCNPLQRASSFHEATRRSRWVCFSIKLHSFGATIASRAWYGRMPRVVGGNTGLVFGAGQWWTFPAHVWSWGQHAVPDLNDALFPCRLATMVSRSTTTYCTISSTFYLVSCPVCRSYSQCPTLFLSPPCTPSLRRKQRSRLYVLDLELCSMHSQCA